MSSKQGEYVESTEYARVEEPELARGEHPEGGLPMSYTIEDHLGRYHHRFASLLLRGHTHHTERQVLVEELT